MSVFLIRFSFFLLFYENHKVENHQVEEHQNDSISPLINGQMYCREATEIIKEQDNARDSGLRFVCARMPQANSFLSPFLVGLFQIVETERKVLNKNKCNALIKVQIEPLDMLELPAHPSTG